MCSSLYSAQQQKQGAVGVLLVADMDLFWEAVSLGIALAGGDRGKGASQ